MHAIVNVVLTWIRYFTYKMFTCSPQEKIIVDFIKLHHSKVYIRLILNTVLLPEWSTAVFFVLFSDSCSWVSCFSWTVKLRAVLRKNPLAPTNSLVFQYFVFLNPFQQWLWFWDPVFHTEDNWETHLQLLQKIKTLTDAPEGKIMH